MQCRETDLALHVNVTKKKCNVNLMSNAGSATYMYLVVANNIVCQYTDLSLNIKRFSIVIYFKLALTSIVD